MDQPQINTPLTRKEFVEKVRSFEHRLLASMADIYCPVHLSLGQEGVAADIYEVIRPEDFLYSTHRNHHHYFAKGGDEQKLWNEIMGLESGLNGGFAGSQGISDKAINFHASAIVGGLVGVAAGTAYALKMDKKAGIAVCCIGDGATEAGVFWETANWCALHSLPIAFIIENNAMSVDSPIEERQFETISSRAEAFGLMKAYSVQEAIEAAREGFPSFHEAHVRLECDHINMATLAVKIA